jgi:hypothetical protein
MEIKKLEIATKKVMNAIKEKKGFNFSRYGKIVNYKNGFMVGGFYECLKTKKDNELDLELSIKKMLKNLDKYFNKDYVLGWWEYKGYIYLDISRNILDLKKAKEIGLKQFQKAIFDIINGKEIFL